MERERLAKEVAAREAAEMKQKEYEGKVAGMQAEIRQAQEGWNTFHCIAECSTKTDLC